MKRQQRWKALAAFAALGVVAPEGIVGQADCSSADWRDYRQLALDYAPTFWFARDEPFYPTNPLELMLDGLDNPVGGRPNGIIDFDPEELRPYRTDLLSTRKIVGIDSLMVPGRPAVFYAVRTMSARDVDDMWYYLRSDEQSWSGVDPLSRTVNGLGFMRQPRAAARS